MDAVTARREREACLWFERHIAPRSALEEDHCSKESILVFGGETVVRQEIFSVLLVEVGGEAARDRVEKRGIGLEGHL